MSILGTDLARPALAWLSGQTMHRRLGHAANRFIYPVLMLRRDLLQPMHSSWLLGHNRPRLFSFYDRDHGDGQTDLVQWFYRQLKQVDLDHSFEIARLELITQPRVCGFVFNPVSFWVAYDSTGVVRVVLCEVNNTFGVRLSYLLCHDDLRPLESKTPLTAYKQLHVSPFFAVQGGYRFWFDLGKDRQHIRISHFNQLFDKDLSTQPDLETTLTLHGMPFDDRHSAQLFWRYGISSVMVVLRIHWQALKLWHKGATFHRSPAPPLQETHHESTV